LPRSFVRDLGAEPNDLAGLFGDPPQVLFQLYGDPPVAILVWPLSNEDGAWTLYEQQKQGEARGTPSGSPEAKARKRR
jgi:hypothetical protein